MTDPLTYLRRCGFVVGYDAGKITLTPTAPMTEAVKRKALRFASRFKAEIISDLASEETDARSRARSRR